MGSVAGTNAVEEETTTSWSSVCSLAAIPTYLGRLITTIFYTAHYRNKLKVTKLPFVILGLRREVDENWALLGYYAASIIIIIIIISSSSSSSSSSFLPTFSEKLSVSSSGVVVPKFGKKKLPLLAA